MLAFVFIGFLLTPFFIPLIITTVITSNFIFASKGSLINTENKKTHKFPAVCRDYLIYDKGFALPCFDLKLKPVDALSPKMTP